MPSTEIDGIRLLVLRRFLPEPSQNCSSLYLLINFLRVTIHPMLLQVYDYLSADALGFCSLGLTVARVFNLTRPRQWLLLGSFAAAAFCYHAHHMLFVLFDYGLNVALCIALGGVQTLLWVAWAVRVRHPKRGRLLLYLVNEPSCSSLQNPSLPLCSSTYLILQFPSVPCCCLWQCLLCWHMRA